MAKIVIIDDEPAMVEVISTLCRENGHQAYPFSSAERAMENIAAIAPHVVIADIKMEKMTGFDVLQQCRELLPQTAVILITAYASVEKAVEAMKMGAYDYVTKPFKIDELKLTVQRALDFQAAVRENVILKKELKNKYRFENIVGSSRSMQNIYQLINKVADTDSTILVQGESGTGKELVARAIHRHSARRDRPFLPAHIAALNPSLVESELFGHVRGAFTGANQARPGLLSLADGGTIFLDELADIPLQVQVKLLRVLEHNEVLPVGANQSQPLNIRILTATHQDLDRRVSEGAFRHDLFFRLNVFQIHLPPLRERREDVLPLAEHFLRRFDPRCLPLLPATAAFLVQQPWLGNVRELRNALEHAVIVARGGPLLPEHFPAASMHGPLAPSQQLADAVMRWLADRIHNAGPEAPSHLYQELLGCVEPALLEEVMRRLQGNRWTAAQWLGLNRATVRKKLAAYNLEDAYRDKKAEEPEGS